MGTIAVSLITFALAVAVVSIIGAAIGVMGTIEAYRKLNAELPNAAEVAVDTFQTTRIYDRNGVLLQEVDNPYYGWRTYVGINQLADDFINATVAAEDATFWTNPGVEPYAIVRGAFINITGAGSSGGSTITQQLVRAVFPDQINAMDISYSRKFREALAAWALAQQYSKSDIFTMYVNQIYYGHRAYGIEAAANTYFDKHASDLTLAEAAFLAGLPQSPSYFGDHFDQAKIRQRYVLNQMVEYRYITRAQADAAFAEPLPLRGDDDVRTGAVSVDSAPHFTEYVRNYVIEHYGEEALFGGLEITTSIDLGLQHRAEQIVANGVANMLNSGFGRNNAAMVVMAPWSGEVLAMVGSADFENVLIDGEVNYATALIQPGSSMKPLVYAAAFAHGLNPGSILFDVPTTWDIGGDQPPYSPQNYSRNFRGAVTIRRALANSLNIPAVKATEYVGVQGVIDTARDMGLSESLEQDASFYGLALGLGSGEVQLLEHTNAYATLANNGTHVAVHPIIRITDSQGNVLYDLNQSQIEKDSNQAIPAGNAYQVTSILTDNSARSEVFGQNNRFGDTQSQLGRPTAAKSGTTDDWKDLWTMGYTTDVAVGVWAGTSGSGNTVGLPEVDGIQAAGPIWQTMMLELHSNPAFSALLMGPDGNPIPKAFAVPADAFEGELCKATGHKADKGASIEEWLVRGQGPDRACGDLSEWETDQLDSAIAATREGDVRWVGDAIGSIARYAAAAGVSGVRDPADDIPRPSVIEPIDPQPGGQGDANSDPDVPIEEIPPDNNSTGDAGEPTQPPIEPE